MTTVILHVSDIHFSNDRTDENDSRALALDGLFRTILEQPSDWRPNVVCLTGDIARRGKSQDYDLAGAWLKKLLVKLSLPTDALFICPGNHDVNRDYASSLARPASAKEADSVLAFPPIPNHYSAIFEAYSQWAPQFGIKPYNLGTHENYLVGSRSYRGLTFVALNTAWCSKDNEDKNRLWIGLPQVRHLEAQGYFPFEDNRSSLPITVTLLHHPKEWLHPDESTAAGMRPNLWDYMGERTDIVLSGHTHGEVRRADTIAETALHFTAGALYPGKNEYFNNFRLLRIGDEGVAYRTFEFNSRSAESRWESQIANVCAFPRRFSSAKSIEPLQTPLESFDIAGLRTKTEAHAKRVLEQKSRAVKPYGLLPELTTLPVRINVQQEKRDEQNRLTDIRPLILPLENALGKSRRTLLLGELGTGKSTLAARAIGVLQARSSSSVAFLIPAKQLDLRGNITSGNLLDAISTFVSGSISPDLPAIQLLRLLRANIETTIFLDGLDEIESEQIPTLLREFAAIPEHWETATVVATGRPIELSGSSYSEWQVVTTTLLTEEDKQQLFEKEGLADALSPEDSREHAVTLVNRLRQAPALSQLISTPLSARLFYFRLSNTTSPDVLTLGDLAYETIQDRLAGWAKQDDKQKTTEYFETYFPDADSRSTLLGSIALELGTKTRLTVAEVRKAIISRCKDIGAPSALCAEEALDFFGKSGLLAIEGDVVQFPANIFLQALIGIGMEASWSSGSSSEIPVNQWREVAFAATISRRKSSLSANLSHIKQFISQLATHESFVPAGAQIVTEAKSQELGEHFVTEATIRKSVDVRFFDDEWDGSARVIATALKVSGAAGFTWFYDKYLDPRYPFIQYGSGLIGAVFKEWVRLSMLNIGPDEKQKISQLVVPMLRANTFQVHDIVASAVFVVPEVFDVGERLVFLARGLTIPQFSEVAASELRKYMESENRQACDAALLGADSSSAALTWLDYNSGIPPSTILSTAVRSLTDPRERSGQQLVMSCKARLGPERWIAFLRFTLSHPDNKVSAGAALGLYDAGEQDLVLLRTPLLQALHDGGYVPRAERVLDELLAKAEPKIDSVEWLANAVHDHSFDISGGHSGEFRLLLKYLPEVANGSSLFAWAILGLGQFVLPRYPEVRQQFRDLMSGADGNEYRKVLEEKLESTNGVERRAAAAVLVTAFPDETSRALQVIVKSTAGGWGMRWHEWEDYLFSINFGIAPLSSLKSELAAFPKEAADFGYRLLLNNAVELTEEEQMRALQGILEHRYRIREVEMAFLKTPKARSKLLDLVKSDGAAHSREAAELLLSLHKDSLSVADLALCYALAITGGKWERYALADQIEKIKANPEYSAAIAELGLKHKQRYSSPLLLDLLRAAVHDQAVWDDIVWEVMCKERVPFHPGDTALWLLETGLRDSSVRAAIGKGAQKCLSEFPKRPFGSADVHQWLVLLVDEFVGMSKQDLEKVVVSSQAIHREVTAALLFRLGTIPARFKMTPDSRPRIITDANPYSEDELQDASRQTEGFPSDLCERIETTIIHRAVSSKEIDKIKARGSNGALIASVVAFTQGIPPSPEYVVLVLPLMEAWRRQRQPGCLDRLFRISMTSQFERLKANAITKSALITLVEQTFAIGGATGELASLLIDLRGYLTGIEAYGFFDHMVKLGYAANRELQERVVRWLVRVPLDYTDELAKTLDAIKNSLAMVTEKKTDKDPALFGEAIADMTLALGFWRLSDKEEVTATNAFWRGLKTLFREKVHQPFDPIVEALEIIEPLLTAVNPDLLRSAVASRRSDSDPFVRAVYVIFNSFAGTRKS